MDNNEFENNINSNEGGSFDLNSFSSVNNPSSENSDVFADTEYKYWKENNKQGFFRKLFLKSNRKQKTTKKKKNVAKTVLTLLLVCIITVSFLISAFAIYVFGFVDDTLQEDLNDLVLNYTTTVYVKDSATNEYVEYKRLHGSENRIWVDYEEMPEYLKDAYVSIEDQRFENHGGVDWKRTISAFANMFLKFSSSGYGGSTITQQLVKNLTGDNSRSPMRKVREIMRARRIEMDYDKDTILECYLNTVCLGGGRYGVEVASNYYFGKHVSDISIAEAASLAAIVKSPEGYRLDTNFESNTERKEVVLKKMYELGKISKEEYEDALAEKIEVKCDDSTTPSTEINSYFVDALIEQVADDLVAEYDMDKSYAVQNVYNGGYKIYCTMEPKVQDAIESVFTDDSNRIKGKAGNNELGQSSITIMDYSGHVVGIAGGLGEKTQNRVLNRATSSPRQPGSTMKPLAVYSLAVEDNVITYSTFLNDKKIYYKNNTWTPKNWYGGYWGNVTAAYALQRSCNAIPVMLVDQMTPQKCYDHLTKKLGITTLNYPQDADLAPCGLGGTNGGITTLESAAAYAVFGNLGYYYKPSFYTLVTDQHDKTVLQRAEKPTAAISEDTATIMNHMLQNVVYGSNGTGKGAGSYVPNCKIYAKTGTSNDTNDLWFVGGTPYYVGSCWYGFDNNGEISQSGIAMKLWGKVMSKVHAGLETKQFEQSQYVDCRYYCNETGLLAKSGCTSVSLGYYKSTYRTACTAHGGSLRNKYVEKPIETSSETASAASAVDTSSASTVVSSTPPVSSQTETVSSQTEAPPAATDETVQ